mgnify:CR=1 FL=1
MQTWFGVSGFIFVVPAFLLWWPSVHRKCVLTNMSLGGLWFFHMCLGLFYLCRQIELKSFPIQTMEQATQKAYICFGFLVLFPSHFTFTGLWDARWYSDDTNIILHFLLLELRESWGICDNTVQPVGGDGQKPTRLLSQTHRRYRVNMSFCLLWKRTLFQELRSFSPLSFKGQGWFWFHEPTVVSATFW